jgi:hypothetical protein
MKMRSERIILEDKHKKLLIDFEKIKKVTTGRINKAADILNHKAFLK